MPRGVYARKSAQERKSAPTAAQKTTAQPAEKVKTQKAPAVKAPKKARTKPSVKPAQLVAPAFLVPPAFSRAKSVDIESIGGDELKAYARSIGITQRDVDGLTEARLRHNCKARLAHNMEED
jgi:hypothetical protein